MRAVIRKFIVVSILLFGVSVMNSWMADAQDDLQAVSEVIKNKRKIFIEEIMELTPQENKRFWPLYDEFESGLSEIRGKRIELATNFVQNHENFSDDEAIGMLKQRIKIDGDELKF